MKIDEDPGDSKGRETTGMCKVSILHPRLIFKASSLATWQRGRRVSSDASALRQTLQLMEDACLLVACGTVVLDGCYSRRPRGGRTGGCMVLTRSLQRCIYGFSSWFAVVLLRNVIHIPLMQIRMKI